MTYSLKGVWSPNGLYLFTLHSSPLTISQGANERLLGSVLGDPEVRSKVFICTKFGVSSHDGEAVICGKPEYVRERCEESLKNLQVDYIDLYYQHRVCRLIYRGFLMRSY